MPYRKLIAGAVALCVVGGGTTAALGANSAGAPDRTTIKAVQSIQVKVNRYIKDNLRWKKDVYFVRSGGTVRIVQRAADDGPHTWSIVKKRDLPSTPKEIFECAVCGQIAQAHGFPEEEGPPAHNFADDGTGQDTPPEINKAGDSAFFGLENGDSVTMKVTAPKGKTLWAICAIHPWMQHKLLVR